MWHFQNRLYHSIFTLQDAFPLGEIILGSSSEGFSVDETAPPELGGGENAFMLNTPTRTYPLLAETSDEKLSWIATLNEAIEVDLSDQCSTLERSANGTYNNE